MRVLDVATLAQWVEAAPVNDSAQVGPDVVIDTRKVTPGALFIALPGTCGWGIRAATTAVSLWKTCGCSGMRCRG